MKNIEPINSFFLSAHYAFIGISENDKQFGNYVYKQMKQRDFSLVPVHYELDRFLDDICYKSLKDAMENVALDAAVILVNKTNAQRAVLECITAGIHNIWLQQGSETHEIIKLAQNEGINLIYGECIIMFLDNPGFGHQLHKYINKLMGKYPK